MTGNRLVVQLPQLQHSQELAEAEPVQDQQLHELHPLHEEGLGHHLVQVSLLPLQVPVTEDLLLRNVDPVPDHGEIQLGLNTQLLTLQQGEQDLLVHVLFRLDIEDSDEV